MTNEQLQALKETIKNMEESNADMSKMDSLSNIINAEGFKLTDISILAGKRDIRLGQSTFNNTVVKENLQTMFNEFQTKISTFLTENKEALKEAIDSMQPECTDPQHKPADAPIGLTGVAPTNSSDNDGKITGLKASVLYEYRGAELAGDFTNVNTNSTEITGLKAGIYDVRVQAEGNIVASKVAKVEVPAYTSI